MLLNNSIKLRKALLDANISFDIMNDPTAWHSLNVRKVNLHRYGLVNQFFGAYLKAAASTP
jgi:hypothetical protein